MSALALSLRSIASHVRDHKDDPYIAAVIDTAVARIEALEQDIAASEHNFRTMRQLRNEAVDRIEALEAASTAVGGKLMALNAQWASVGGPFDDEWLVEVLAALAPEQD